MANNKNFKIKNGLALDDNKKIELGDSADLQIYHDGGNSLIQDAGTGDLILKSNGAATVTKTNAGNNLISARDAGSVGVFYDGSEKLTTTSTGIDVTGNATFADNGKAIFGAGSDLQIYHDGSNSVIQDAGTGNLNLRADNNVNILNNAGTEFKAQFITDGAVNLFYDNSKKLATTSTGIDVTGNVSATGNIILEGSTADDFETTVTVTDPTADRTFTIPDQTGTAMLWQQPWPDDPASTGNIAIGDNTLSNLDSGGQRNIAIGSYSLSNVTSGDFNTAVGALTLNYLTTGGRNTAVGTEAGSSSSATTVTDNTYVGHQAGQYSTGSSNTSIGKSAGGNTSASNFMVNLGYQAGYESGDSSVNIGYQAGYNTSMNQGAVGTVTMGRSAGTTITSGDYNTVIGAYSNVGSYNSGAANRNVAIGVSTVTGYDYNVSIGTSSTLGHTTAAAQGNVNIGFNSGNGANSDYGVYIGRYSGYNNDANYSVFIGEYSGGAGNKTGNSNTGIGEKPLYNLSSGGYNSAYGAYAGYKCTTGSSNTYLGTSSGGTSTTGHETGSNCSFLGNGSIPSSTSVSNEITLGNSSITSLRCNVTTISSLSDERDKTDIEDLPYGLDFINDMRPVQFTWDRRDGSMNNVPDFGFIAQDLHDVELEHSSTNRTRLVKWENPDKLEADYVRSYPILVKAVQELSAKCDALEARLAALEGV